MQSYSFHHWVHVQLGYGFAFFGAVEVILNNLDPKGWWIKDVTSGGEPVPEAWGKIVKDAIDRDYKTYDEITGKCVREIARITDYGTG